MVAKNGNTSSRTKVTSCSPDMALAQDDQRIRSRGTVSTPFVGAFSGLRSVQSPAKREVYSRPGRLGLAQVGRVDALDHVEEEQEAELFGVGQRIGIAAAIEIVADLIDLAAHVGGEGHWWPLVDGFVGPGRIVAGRGLRAPGDAMPNTALFMLLEDAFEFRLAAEDGAGALEPAVHR